MAKTGRPRKQRSDPLPTAPAPVWHRPLPQKVNPPGANVTDVAAYWREHLPKPPRGSQDDGEVAAWVDSVSYAGGAAALGWLRDAENWPKSLGPVMRGRMLYYVLLCHERASNEARQAQLAAQRDLIERQQAERRRQQYEQGW